MDKVPIQIGKTYELRLGRRTVIARVASRVLVRGDWFNCIEAGSEKVLMAHRSEFVRQCDVEAADEVQPPALKQRRRSRLATAATILAIMPLGYILSVGPAYGMQRREKISETTFDQVYWPLLSLAQHSETVQSLLARYSQWWT